MALFFYDEKWDEKNHTWRKAIVDSNGTEHTSFLKGDYIEYQCGDICGYFFDGKNWVTDWGI